MDIQAILDNLEQYTEAQQEAIRLAVDSHEGEMLETILKAIIGE